ncbi:MAG: TldD/PmbA family protein [Aestuariivirga sp.]
MTHSLSDLTQSLLDEARKAGADSADTLAVSGRSLSISTRLGALEQADRSETVEIGLRVFVGNRQACVSASDVSTRTRKELAERAVAMAREAPEDRFAGLAEPGQLTLTRDAAALDLVDLGADPLAADLQEDARRAEAAAMAQSGIVQCESGAGWGRQEIFLAASNGFAGGYARSSRSTSLIAFTGEGTGMERDWAGESRIYAADLPPPEEIGTKAAERTLARHGAVKPPTGIFPVMFDERVASSLIGHLLSAVNGDAIARGASWARDLLGLQVLPKGFSLIEDPHRIRISSSRPFDGEGLPTKRRLIVDDGVLTGWTLDLATGRRLGMGSTGSAARGTGAPPSPSTTNIDLSLGTDTPEALISGMGTGLLVTSMIGSTINPTTGDYSRGASGFWVENGEIRHPVNECTIAGNLRDMLIRMIPANDIRPHLSTRVPSILIEGMTLAGK